MYPTAEANQALIDAFSDNKRKPKWSKEFPVIGKGILLFNFHQKTPFFLKVCPMNDDCARESWIGLHVHEKSVSFHYKKKNKKAKQLDETTHHNYFEDDVGLEPRKICTYWLSYDSDRMVVKYGKGYCMEKTTILRHQFEKPDESENEAFFAPSVKRKVELYDNIQGTDQPDAEFDLSLADVEPEVDFDPDPLVNDVKPLVKDSSKANLFDLDSGRFIYSSSLPPACQALYANVTAANVDLHYVPNNVNQYKFFLTDAIRYSIETEGCALNKRLTEKKGEFGSLNLTYLRITLGKEYGACPGVPYVLELWPKSHGSPVHNHGNAYAVIRVLHGGLTVHYYNKMTEGEIQNSCKCQDDDPSEGLKELGKVDVKKGDVTWLSPRWYQTHRLQNDTNDFCATVQCYAYGTNDHTHWPYFDYMKSCSRIGEFKPDSDFGFTEMYNIVMKEYAAKKKRKAAKKRKARRIR